MADASTRYDIAIIGSGVSGSSLGAILARHGLRMVDLPCYNQVAASHRDYSAERFKPLEELTLRYVAAHDRVVANSYNSWSKIDAIIEAVDPCDEAAVDRAVAESRALYAATPWVPWAFRQLLAGRNHLPANKLRLSLLRQSSAGFMGEGAFRQHFFGDATMAEVARFFAGESVKYSASALILRKRLGFRRRPAAPSPVQASRG